MDAPQAGELAHNDVPDVSTYRLADLAARIDELAPEIERLIASTRSPLEVPLGWGNAPILSHISGSAGQISTNSPEDSVARPS